MNNTIAIKADRELLERARIDLVSAGFTDCLEWNNMQQATQIIRYLVIDENNIIVLFSSLYKAYRTIRMNHTNYTEVINQLKQRLCTPSKSH